jgi:hypothetical protein
VSIPKVHKDASDGGWRLTECGMRRRPEDAALDWNDVTCKLCLRTKARRERFASRAEKAKR